MSLNSEKVKLHEFRFFLICFLISNRVNHPPTHQIYLQGGSDPKTSPHTEHTLNYSTRLNVTEFLIKTRFKVVWLEKKKKKQ